MSTADDFYSRPTLPCPPPTTQADLLGWLRDSRAELAETARRFVGGTVSIDELEVAAVDYAASLEDFIRGMGPLESA